MLNKFCKKPLYEVTRTLAKVAMGAEKADLVIKNARLVNVCTCEIRKGLMWRLPRAGSLWLAMRITASAEKQK